MGPTWSRFWLTGTMPSSGHAPHAPLKLATPQKLAGRVIDPPVCVPSATGHMPLATAAALPALDPPGERARFQGLRVRA